MGWIPAVLLCVGLVFLIVEVLMPGFGFFGITGGLLVIAGVIVRIVDGLNLLQSVSLVLMVIGCLLILVILMVISAKSGILGHSGIFETKSTLSSDYAKVDKNMKKLIGKSGKTLSVLNLGGKAKIAGKIYDVMSISSYIESGAHIKVVEIKNNTIMVRKWFE